MRFPPRLSLKTSKNSTVAPPGQNGSVPKIFLRHLINIEPNAQFEFYQPDLIKSPGAIYYAKTSTIPKPMKLRRAEAELIKFLDQVAPGLAPDLIASGSIKNLIDTGLGCETYRSYFLYKWEELRPLSSSSAETLARRLANDVHSHIGPNGFGIYNPNSDPTEGVSYTSWEECFSTLMAGTLFRLETLGYPRLCYKGNKIKKSVIPMLLNPEKLEVLPVLIHGNLWGNHWAGDTGQKSNGEPVAYNPAPMFAHNEFDLAIGRLLGRLPSSFYTGYHQQIPKSNPVKEYELRLDLYVLFYYLNHIIIFGGRHASIAEEKMNFLLLKSPKKVLRFAPGPTASTSRRSQSLPPGQRRREPVRTCTNQVPVNFEEWQSVRSPVR